MKRQVVFIHGGESFSNYEDFLQHIKTCEVRNPLGERPKRWQDSFREDLGEQFEVYMPQMPNKQNAKYEEWKIWFERYFEFLKEDVILIGHSQGGSFLVKYLTESQVPFSVKVLYILAAPIISEDFGGEDGGDFLPNKAHIKDIQDIVKDIYIFHSKDDFVVPFSHGEQYVELLPKAQMVIFEDKGHFLTETFSELVEHIKAVQ